MRRNRRLLTRRISLEELWSRLADVRGGEVLPSGDGRVAGVSFKDGRWRVDVGIRKVDTGQARVTFTRVRSHFAGARDAGFKVLPRNVLHRFSELFGRRDLRIGRADFDSAFTVRASSSGQVRSLLTQSRISDALMARGRWTLGLDRASKRARQERGPDLLELKMERSGVEREPEILLDVVDLVFLVCRNLERLGIARTTRTDPKSGSTA